MSTNFIACRKNRSNLADLEREITCFDPLPNLVDLPILQLLYGVTVEFRHLTPYVGKGKIFLQLFS